MAHKKVAIVFGAYVMPGGQPSFILRDRLDAGIALYKAHTVDKLLMSGDNRFENYNEPDAMRDYAISQGVKADDVVADYGGRDTYDTCYRAKHIFGLDSAILVTQNYHAPRAVYIARGLGLNAVAYGIPDFEKYPTLRLPYSAREYVADLKAWWDVNLGHRRARVMGAPETSLAFGSGRIHPRFLTMASEQRI
jgi:vancomycin permeability regulator SanA